MKVLITAGSTQVNIDKVRIISNIFKGSTGTLIAKYFCSKGDDITLVTSNLSKIGYNNLGKYNIITYKTFEELEDILRYEITMVNYNAVIHSAAVSDYEVAGVFHKNKDGNLVEIPSEGKVSSQYEELYLKMSPTCKIIDKIRKDWCFSGYLVKFKLQVGMLDEELLKIAEKSRKHSDADMIVANCLEWCRERAYILSKDKQNSILRYNLPEFLYNELHGY